MLQQLRDKTSGLIAKIVLGALIFVFSFFGIESYFMSQGQTWVAKVGDKEISPEEFRQRFEQYRSRMTQMMGGNVDGAMFEKPETKLQVLNGLIDEKLLLNANDDLGAYIPDSRIKSEITAIDAFKTNGQFDETIYRATLASVGKTPTSFQEEVRGDLATRELPMQIAASSVVTGRDIDDYIKLRDQTRDIRYLVLDKPANTADAIDDAKIAQFYKDHAAEFMTPEQVALEYIDLDGSKLAVAASPDEAMLKERYEKDKARYVTAEQRLASHILVSAKDGNADAQKAALAKAQDLAKQAKEGKAFAELAKQSSDDVGSKAQGGDLGWLEKGNTDPAFDAALFALDKGTISEPVLSSEGYHVIELRDVRPEKVRTFDEVKAELGKDFVESERERVFNDQASALTDAVYADPSSLEPASKQLGIAVQRTPLFSRNGGEGIAAMPDVIRAAFSDPVLVEGNTSDPIDIGTDRKLVVRVAEHKPSVAKPIESVREEIRTRLASETAAKLAKEHADALLARLQKGESLEQLATESKGKVTEAKATGRSAANTDGRVVEAAFKLPRPAAGKSESTAAKLADNGYAIVAVDAVADGDPTKVDQAGRDAVREQLKRNDASSSVKSFLTALRERTKVEIAEDRLQ